MADVASLLHQSATRRRLAFWRAAKRLSGHRVLSGQPLQDLYQMEVIGYRPELKPADITWLLEDAPTRESHNERRLAVDALLSLWKQAGSLPDVLSEIERVVRSDSAMQQTYDNWLTPPPRTAAWIAQEKDFERNRKLHEAERDARDQSWLDFFAELRKNPNQLRQIRPTANSIDRRLYCLWELLCGASDADTHFAVDSVSPLEPMLGKEVALALQDALIQYWRLWQPLLRSARPRNGLNQVRNMDLMGLAGVSLEARHRPHWANNLSQNEALRAVAYATLELNGFPSWLPVLAAAKPDEVRQVLLGELLAELREGEPKARYEVLERLAWADAPIVELVADDVFETLSWWSDPPASALEPMLSIIIRGLRGIAREQLAECALSRFSAENDGRTASLYLGAAYAVNVTVATDALTATLNALSIHRQTALVEQLLPQLFGTDRRHENGHVDLSFECLERLVSIAFGTIRREDDINRPSGEVYSPGARDNAEEARGAAFNRLVETPGRATFDVLRRHAKETDWPISGARLLELSVDRAAQDSESAAWLAGETLAFERTAETMPYTSLDLQRLALRRLDDIQHDLLHADFAQGATVQSLPDEKAVQIWMAERLTLTQGRSYSVEREPHVVEEKEPDVRLRAKTSNASVPIEIKVPESWTLGQLESALTDQLCGRYLRARDARHGILLLVHQAPRPIGWENSADGSKLTIADVVTHLKRRAAALCGISPDAPQPDVAMIDVSSCGYPKPKKAPPKKTSNPRRTAGRGKAAKRAAGSKPQ